MMEGFIRQLLRDIELSNILRKMFIFHIVPMLNPDGVVAGNFRTSYSGKDLNRQFNKLDKYIFP
jgi:murein tripeptide amidase MpaA